MATDEFTGNRTTGKSSEEILNRIALEPRMTIPQLAEELHLSTRAIEKQIAA